MNKRLIALFLGCMMILGCAGCQLARPEAEDASAEQDRLIGVYVTKGHLDLFDFESYFNDNAGKILNGGEISLADSAAYEGRYYAALNENHDYVFEGLDGIGFYAYKYADEAGSYTATHIDEGMVGNDVHFFSTDEGERVELDGTVYVTARSRIQIYANPVYQTADGEVYLTGGQGFMANASDYEGEVYSAALENTTTVTENGVSQSMGCKITVRLAMMFTPVEITVIQMDGESHELSRRSYAPEAMPEAVTVEEDCAYLVVGTHKSDSSGKPVTTWELVDPAQESWLRTFHAREDGVCIRQDTELLFPGRVSA